jgi:hypothetical protein
MMDPIGFGFEKFDAIGQWHEKQTVIVMPAHGEQHNAKPIKVALDIDSTAVVSGIPNSKFSSPKELGLILAETPSCQQCMVRQLFRYAYGRHETAEDEPVIQKGAELFRSSGFRWKQLLLYFGSTIASPEGKS